MKSNWEKVKLGDYVDILTGFPFQSKYFSDSEGIRLVRGDNLSPGFLDWKNTKYWPKYQDSLKEYLLKENDVLIGMDGSKVGRNKAQVRKEDLSLLLVQRVACLRAKKGLLQDYLYFVIFSKQFTRYVDSIKTGSAVPHISAKQIADYEFYLPPLEEQKMISQTLAKMTEKIELNKIMGKTLESIGQAIFKHWFIDFAFPNEEGILYKSSGGEMIFNEELGKNIPKGWEVKPIDQVSEFLNGLALQKYPPENEEDYLPVIKIRELRQGITESSDKANPNIPNQYIIKDGDILFSWSGSLDVCIWCGGEGALNQHLFKVTSQFCPKWFYYYWIKWYMSKFQQIASGKATTMGHVRRYHLSETLVLVPPGVLLEKMDKIMTPLMNRLISNGIESLKLKYIRDAILPKLLSGEFRVKVNIEKETEKVVEIEREKTKIQKDLLEWR